MNIHNSADPLPLEVVVEHQDFIVINKPCGRSFHDEGTATGIVSQLKKQLSVTIWPVHRLDKLTSGLLVFAKSKRAAAQFGHLFENQKISKTYIAVSDRKPKKKQGYVIGDMKKSRGGSWMLCRSKESPAKTHFVSQALHSGLRLFWITPSTGKTHQIRVALKSVGAPILGDRRYAGAASDRGYLHAYRLTFIWQNQPIKIEVEPTEGQYFQNVDLTQSIRTGQLTSNPNPFG